MKQSLLGRFFGVVARPRTWTSVLFNMLAFPLGLFYFVFFVTGLSVGLGLVIIWVGIPILLLVVGAWWLFAAFERLQAEYLLGADVAGSPRPWEEAEGIWGRIKAHFGSASTWKDLLYLLAKMGFGIVSFTVMVTLAGILFWLVYLPVAHFLSTPFVDFGNGRAWTPPLWLAIVAIPGAILWVFLSLHILNGWSWICARWAELLLRDRPAVRAPAALVQPEPLVSTSPQSPVAPAQLVSTVPQPPAGPAVPPPPQPPVAPTVPPSPASPGAQIDKPDSSSD